MRDLVDGFLCDVVEKKGPHKFQCLFDGTVHNSENQIIQHMKTNHMKQLVQFLSDIQRGASNFFIYSAFFFL